MGTFDGVDHQMTLEEGLSMYQIQDHVLNQLKGLGIPIPEAPVQITDQGIKPYQGELPQDLTELDDKQLGQYLDLMAKWIDYISGQLTVSDMVKRIAEEKRDFVEAKIRAGYKLDEEGKKRAQKDMDMEVKKDRRYAAINKDFLALDIHYTFVRVVLKSAEKKWASVSRRITQQTQGFGRDGRTSGVMRTPQPGVPVIPHGRL